MSHRILITGAHILSQDPQQPDGVADVLVEDGKISRDRPRTRSPTRQIIDGTDRHCSPASWTPTVTPGRAPSARPASDGTSATTASTSRTRGDRTSRPKTSTSETFSARRRAGRGDHHPPGRIAHPEQPRTHQSGHRRLQASGIRGIFAYGWPSIDSTSGCSAEPHPPGRHPPCAPRASR